MKTKLALLALALMWAAPASAGEMEMRCSLIRNGTDTGVQAITGETDFDIIVRNGKCMFFVRQKPETAFTPGKRAAWFIDGRNGDILAEFFGDAKDGKPFEPDDVGLCSFRGGIPFKTSQCKWSVWLARASWL